MLFPYFKNSDPLIRAIGFIVDVLAPDIPGVTFNTAGLDDKGMFGALGAIRDQLDYQNDVQKVRANIACNGATASCSYYVGEKNVRLR
jgi:hypothetical protein